MKGKNFSYCSYILILGVLTLYTIGCLFIFEISSAEAIDSFEPGSRYQALIKQLIFGVSSSFVGALVFFIGAKKCLKWSSLIYWFQLILLLAVFIPGLGVMRNGSSRWFGVGSFLIQPSEFAKITIGLFAIHFTRYWTTKKSKVSDQLVTAHHVLTLCGYTALCLALIIIEPDNRTTALTASVLFVVLFHSRISLRYWLIPMMVFATLSIGIASQFDYVQKRIAVYVNPQLDPYGRGYQPTQAKIAVGSGGVLGRGIGHSLQKFSYLPEAQNDYIAAIIAEESGFVGIVFILTIYVSMLLSAFSIMINCKDEQLSRLASVLTYILAIQMVINLCVVVGVFPSTGLNLPFISQGGSSLWANTIIIALILSLDQESKKFHEKLMQV